VVDRTVIPGSAFLLTQLGTYAAQRFAERVAALDLIPPKVGLLWNLAMDPGHSQQTYAKRLGAPPSRFVKLVDDMEERGLVERRKSEPDRRANALHLTEVGKQTLQQLADIGQAHEQDLFADLSDDERRVLHDLLRKVADSNGLTPGVHPGFKQL